MDNGFIGEIRAVPYDYAPLSWVACDGQPLSVSSYQALFAVIGYTYGGSGSSFNTPNLNDRAPVGVGNGPGLSSRSRGDVVGQSTVALTTSQMPGHTHEWNGSNQIGDQATPQTGLIANIPGTVEFRNDSGNIPSPIGLASTMMSTEGGGMPHENRQPFLTLRYCICFDGTFPSYD